MQHPLEIGAHFYPHDVHPDQRSHRYRSFMIEEILTDHPDHKVSSPTGDLLKFGVHALLSARPYHNHLGKSRDLSVRQYFEIRHGQSFNLNTGTFKLQNLSICLLKDKRLHVVFADQYKANQISQTEIYAMRWTEQACENCKCTFISGPLHAIHAFFSVENLGKKTLTSRCK